ncbi:conserved hypothetical protein [Hyella patelloides LEGE 07179]|uniref:Prepilin-type N-terminal cleavage/methylation domain-containing protein n=1 Tax=Hyella patelloides LEGE 07179 TaxID=945734 RepID=A0A563VTK6_9CYAN|nr:hypothetical protein [Hyella patelloides]VEP14728.1 conserved hypothetical protein [Hyella patelloides LEGE 07179]
MLKTIITLKNTKNKSFDRGFITIEILIAIFIAFGFLAVSLQTLVLAMVFQVGAQKEQRADQLIQEEIEALNDLGSTLNFGANTADACDGNLDLDGGGTNNDGYGQGLWNELIEDDPLIAATSTTNSSTTTILGRTLTIEGTQVAIPAGASPTPHRILGVSYQVTEPDVDGDGNAEVIANRYVEVIPDEALECP